MVLHQILKYIDNNLNPALGTKIQIKTDDKSEVIKIFIFNKENKSYDYILNFIKGLTTSDTNVFSSSITSGYSGIEYKLDCGLNEEIYEDIKRAIIIADNIHIKSLEKEIESILVPKEDFSDSEESEKKEEI